MSYYVTSVTCYGCYISYFVALYNKKFNVRNTFWKLQNKACNGHRPFKHKKVLWKVETLQKRYGSYDSNNFEVVFFNLNLN